MFDIELIRKDLENTKKLLSKRNFDTNKLDEIVSLDIENRALKTKIQDLNAQRNALSKQIGILMGQKNIDEAEQLKNKVKEINIEIEKDANYQEDLDKKIINLLAYIPNVTQDCVPFGADETFNQEIKKFSEPTKFDFQPLAHWDIATNNDWIDFERATKVSGSRFTIYKGNGARLFRALQQYTLDLNIKNGFQEILPPVIVLDDSLYGSGQLPKFAEDVYQLTESKYFLSPTAEVQLVNMHRDEILNNKELPIKYTANTPCFRSEAGSAGRDTRGVIRQHQFWKSELVEFCTPETSDVEHEKLTRSAEMVLETLNLPYRRIILCTGDTGFSSSKTFDLEVWLPSYSTYKEISSCSNCLAFQARRAKIRYKDENNNTQYVHTLNGSSLAIDRLWAAVVENYQQPDGSVNIPDALIPYMNGVKNIK